MRKAAVLISLLLVVSLALLASCAKSEEDAPAQIVGKWQWADETVTEYQADGTFVSASGWEGTWALEENVLSIDGPSEFHVAYQVEEIGAERLLLKDATTEQMVEGTRLQ